MAETRFLRSGWMLASVASLTLGIASTGCGGSGDDETDPGVSPTPTATPKPATFDGEIQFRNLTDGATLVLDYDRLSASVAYEVSSFIIQPEGQCADPKLCGHVEVLVDGTDGNQSGKDYNNDGTANPIDVFFGDLASPIGEHTITLKLVYDDGSDTGVETSITVNTALPAPAVAVLSPNATNNTVLIEDTSEIEVTYTATNVELKAPGTCGSTPNCGHIYVQIDGNEGNQTGKDYNNISYDASVPVTALLNELDTKTGEHTITLSLRNDDGSPYLLASGANVDLPVQANATVYVKSKNDPELVITNMSAVDTDGDGTPEAPEIVLGPDGLRTFNIEFTAKNVTLSESCNSVKGTDATSVCGHIGVKIDGNSVLYPDDANAPGSAFNNEGVGTSLGGGKYSIPAHFHWLEYFTGSVTGTHTVSIALVDDNGVQITASELPVLVSATGGVTTNPDVVGVSIVSPNANAQNVVAQGDDMAVQVNYGVFVPTDMDVTWGLPDTAACQTAKTCYHVRLFIDGDLGNQSNSLPYNNLAAPTLAQAGLQVDALFSYVEANGGVVYTDPDAGGEPHHVTMVVYDKNSKAVTLPNSDGTSTPISAGVRFFLAEPIQPN